MLFFIVLLFKFEFTSDLGDLNLFHIWVYVDRSHYLYWRLQLLIDRSDDCYMHRVGCSDLFYERMILKLMVLFKSVLNLSGLLYLLNYKSTILVYVLSAIRAMMYINGAGRFPAIR